MRLNIFHSLVVAAAGASALPNGHSHGKYNLKPYTLNLGSEVPRMLELVRNSELPSIPEYPGLSPDAGIPLSTLKSLRSEWLTKFNWNKEQAAINRYPQYTAEIEGLTVHFIHQKSSDPNAIPLILFHGWPGSFLEFIPLINDLTKKGRTSKGKSVTFDVIIPSLPGFGPSTAPPANWSTADTARVFNTLMTDVLGYKKYATHGTDWGCSVAYHLYSSYNTTVRASQFVFLPFFPYSPDQLAAENIKLDALEKFEEQGFVNWVTTGQSYFAQMSTKPNTIGLALYDNPVGQLAWIGEKFLNWSDPRAGTGPSVLTHNEILTTVSLYYLTKSFNSAGYIYYQNQNGFATTYTKAETDAPLLFSSFKYNVAFWPAELVNRTGNLAVYNNHDFGGHFPSLDNPPAMISDLRDIANYWK
ncbi:alpha beta-hydrolase [Trichoderma arundinaceum]|uniref:Alpha beta-hydrolase n=1 Tax=Trichoderma arundinaceum TaxID=490622 RepID=A0A395NV86_TRIAR|nr:alpha beta-hydrolase [Trichoderma arundinaceum]